MSLQFVLGRAKTGKSYFMYNKMITENRAKPDNNYIFIVPEQSSLSVQQELVRAHHEKSILGIEVLSFKRLAYKIFEENGKKIPVIIDEIGKSMLLKKVLIEVNEQLTVFKGSCRRPGFIAKLKTMLSEFAQYEISDDMLLDASDKIKDKPQIYAKLRDLYIISSEFKKALAEKYITSEQILPQLTSYVSSSEILKNSVIVLDGFHDLTPVQYSLMRELLCKCLKVYVVLDITKEELTAKRSENLLFSITRGVIDTLSLFAEKSGVCVDSPIWMEKNSSLYSSREIQFLENHYEQIPGIYKNKTEDILFIEAETPDDEVTGICSQIIKCTKDYGLHYGDMAVITSDMKTYGTILERHFNQADIPYFWDERHSLRENVGVESILAALGTVVNNFSYESVFRYLKCGLFCDAELIDCCENYCLGAGIRGIKAFKRKWDKNIKGISESSLKRINENKDKFFLPLYDLNDSVKGKIKVRKRINALREWMKAVSFEERMKDISEELEIRGEFERSQEYRQVVTNADRLFNQIEEMIGDEIVPIKELSEILEAGFNEISAGVIPPTVDSLVIADMRRSRLSDVKVVFVIGINDGVFPESIDGTGILSDLDRESLKRIDFRLAPTSKRESFTDKFHIYRIFTKPSFKLYLSWSRQSQDRKSIRPSYVVGQIRRMFPNISYINNTYEIYHIKQGLDVLASHKAEDEDALKDFYRKRPEYLRYVNLIDDAAGICKKNESITPAYAMALFGDSGSTSVTHLEQFASCKLAHFLKYGLQLNKRQEYGLKNVDMGNLYHSALDYIFKTIINEGIHIDDIGQSRIEELIDNSINKTLDNFTNGRYGTDLFESSDRFGHIKKRMADVLRLNLKVLIFHLSSGKYKTVYTEMGFGMSGSNTFPPIDIDGGELSLMGKIDRLDVALDDEEGFVRIIDYKTDDTAFDFTRFYYGIQMQLMVYLDAAMKQNPDADVGGAFYYHIDEPMVNVGEEEIKNLSDCDKERIIFEKQADELKMRGVLNDSEKSLDAFESSISGDNGYKTSKILKSLKLTKDGYSSSSPVISNEAFAKMMNMAEKKASELENDMLSGSVDADPYVYDNEKPCRFCEFRQACGFSTDFPGYSYRRLEKQSMLKILGIIDEQEEQVGCKVDRGSKKDN